MMLKTPYSKSNKKMCENEIENTLEIFEVICNLNVSFWIMIQKYIKNYDIEINHGVTTIKVLFKITNLN